MSFFGEAVGDIILFFIFLGGGSETVDIILCVGEISFLFSFFGDNIGDTYGLCPFNYP